MISTGIIMLLARRKPRLRPQMTRANVRSRYILKMHRILLKIKTYFHRNDVLLYSGVWIYFTIAYGYRNSYFKSGEFRHLETDESIYKNN